jgi:hypothetical protein
MHTFNLIADGLAIGTNALFGVWLTYQLLEACFPIRASQRPA